MVPRFGTDTHLSSTSVACLPLDLCHSLCLQQRAPASQAGCGWLRDAQGESVLRLGDDEVWYWQEARCYLDLRHLELGCCAAHGPQRAWCQRVGRGSHLVTGTFSFQLGCPVGPWSFWRIRLSRLRRRGASSAFVSDQV